MPFERLRMALAGMALLACTACEAAPSQAFSLTLEARTDHDKPLAGVRLWGRGQLLGATDRAGQLVRSVRGRPGQPLALSIGCPAGFETERPDRRIVLGRARRPDARAAPLTVRASCERHEFDLALVVRSRPGIPVLVDGERLGQTNADGLEHLLVRVTPATRLQLGLDTSMHEKLLPRDPTRIVYAEARDDVLLWEQPLAAPVRTRRVRKPERRQPPPEPPIERPVRIDSPN